MLAKERHTKILALLKQNGAVTTTELIDTFGVSIETVRRDLLQLERIGALQRVHGGAVALGQMPRYEALPQRLEANQAGKAELCETAATLVQEDDILCIDSGSTAIHFAQALLTRLSRLTVVTHSMDVFEILSHKEGFQVILCGGHYLKSEKAFYGQLVLDSLKQLHVRKAFLFPSAISLTGGICDFSPELVQVQRQIIASADKTYFLANSEKFEKNALLKLCDATAAHTYVTDSALPPHYKQLYLEQGRTVITCKEDII